VGKVRTLSSRFTARDACRDLEPDQIAAWDEAQVTNGPTETKYERAREKGSSGSRLTDLGMTNLRHWRIRVLLYAGHPDWSKLATVTPMNPPKSEAPV
jgi:hypothetical protein